MSQSALVERQSDRTQILVASALLAAVGVAAFCFLSRSAAQFVVAPLVLCVLWRVRIFSVRVPPGVFVVAALGVAVGAMLRYSQVTLSQGAFLVSIVGDQQLQKESKIYRDRMRRVVGSSADAFVGLHRGHIETAEQARRILDDSAELGGIVWGSALGVTASLQKYPALGFTAFAKGSVAQRFVEHLETLDLYIIRTVPSIEISDGNRAASVAYVARVAALWRDVLQAASPGADLPGFENQAIELATMRARWTSYNHLKFALWMAGTRHLVRAIEGQHLDVGELQCAQRRFEQALKGFKVGDNPDLETAIRANYAIALLLQADRAQKGRKMWKAATRQLQLASRAQKSRSDNAMYALLNRLAIEHATRGVGHEKRRR